MKTKIQKKQKGGRAVGVWVGPAADTWLRDLVEQSRGLLSESAVIRAAAAAGLPLVANLLGVKPEQFDKIPDDLSK